MQELDRLLRVSFGQVVQVSPHAVLVETVLDGLVGKLVKLAKLPLAGDGSLVPGVTKVIAERPDARWHADTLVLAN